MFVFFLNLQLTVPSARGAVCGQRGSYILAPLVTSRRPGMPAAAARRVNRRRRGPPDLFRQFDRRYATPANLVDSLRSAFYDRKTTLGKVKHGI